MFQNMKTNKILKYTYTNYDIYGNNITKKL